MSTWFGFECTSADCSVGIIDVRTEEHVGTTAEDVRMLNERLRRDRILCPSCNTLMHLSGEWEACGDGFGSRGHHQEPWKCLFVLRALAAAWEHNPERLVARHADGSPITAAQMMGMMRGGDPEAQEFVQDLHGALLRMLGAGARTNSAPKDTEQEVNGLLEQAAIAIAKAREESLGVLRKQDQPQRALRIDSLAAIARDLSYELARTCGKAPWSTSLATSELRWVWIAVFVAGSSRTVTKMFFGCAPAFVAGLVTAAEAVLPGEVADVFVLPDDYHRMCSQVRAEDLERVMAEVRAECDADELADFEQRIKQIECGVRKEA